VLECAPEPVSRTPAGTFLPTVHNGQTVNRPGLTPSFAADFPCAQLCATYSPSSAPTAHSSDSRKGHESPATTRVYLHADMKLKEQALARLAPGSAPEGRYTPPDSLLAFLDAL